MRTRSKDWRFLAACAFGLMGALSSNAAGQEFPTKPIKIILPFPPGGIVDPLTRTVSQKVSESIRQPFLIEHQPGSGGVIAANNARQQPADGYTLFLGTAGTHATNKALFAKLPYDPVKDFEPITILASVQEMLVVPASSPAKSVSELIALGKSKPGGLSHATPGVGTPNHLIAEMFASRTGTPIVNVHYKGAAQAILDMLAGRVDMHFSSVFSIAAHIKSGKARGLAIGASARSRVFPDIPTLTELGLPGIDLEFWFGLFAPARTPQPVVQKLYEEFAKALGTPEVSGWLANQELSPPLVTPKQFGAIIAADIDRLGKVVRDSGARVD